jgi:hypothetical protein
MAAPYPSGQVVQARPKAFYTQLLFLKQCHVHLARLRVDQTMKISCLVVIQATCWSSYEYFKQVDPDIHVNNN